MKVSVICYKTFVDRLHHEDQETHKKVSQQNLFI